MHRNWVYKRISCGIQFPDFSKYSDMKVDAYMFFISNLLQSTGLESLPTEIQTLLFMAPTGLVQAHEELRSKIPRSWP